MGCLLKKFMQLYYDATRYKFQIKECSSKDCHFCSILQLLHLSPGAFALSFIPDQMLNHSKEHYKPFSEVFDTATNESDNTLLLAKSKVC